MIPEVGATCKFTFVTRFITLSGVYRIRAETTFQDALASGIDFVSNLYIPAGLQQADFNVDQSQYFSDKVVVLESVLDDSVVYYVPESIFQTFPDPTVKEYFPLVLVVNLGVQENTQAIYPLLDSVKDLVQSTLGTTDPLRIITNPQNKVYLTDAEYAILVEARQTNIQSLIPLTVQVHALQQDNLFLAAKVASYEALLAQVASATPSP